MNIVVKRNPYKASRFGSRSSIVGSLVFSFRFEIRLVLQECALPVTGPLFDNHYEYIRENHSRVANPGTYAKALARKPRRQAAK